MIFKILTIDNGEHDVKRGKVGQLMDPTHCPDIFFILELII